MDTIQQQNEPRRWPSGFIIVTIYDHELPPRPVPCGQRPRLKSRAGPAKGVARCRLDTQTNRQQQRSRTAIIGRRFWNGRRNG